MLEQTGNALKFYAHFVESKVGKTGLTVTVDVYRNGTEIVTAGNAVEVGDGLYSYELASGSNNAEGEYICIFKTATTSVDQQHIPALWVVNKAGVENLTGDLATILADTNELQADDVPGLIAAIPAAPAASANADAVWDEARSGHTTQGTYGESFYSIVSGAALTGTLSTTQMTSDLTEATDDHYNGRVIVWVSGNLYGQASVITDYDGAAKKLTFTAVTEAPSNGDKFIIV